MRRNRWLRRRFPGEADGRDHSIPLVEFLKRGQVRVMYVNRIERKKYGRVRTVSNLILMLPIALVAPTGIMLNKPYRQRPSMATRPLSTNRFCRCLAIQGETENSPWGTKSPVNERGVES